MPNINLSFAQDPNTLALALIYGMVPAVAWLFFWLREQRARPKGTGSLLYAFMAGALMVIAALPVEKFLGTFSTNVNTLTILWATAEEVLKFSAFLLMLFAGSSIEAPVDYAMYAVVVALGFAGFENALYFLQPLQTGDSVVLLLAGAMRFLGTTLMHAAAASIPGIAGGRDRGRHPGRDLAQHFQYLDRAEQRPRLLYRFHVLVDRHDRRPCAV